MTTIGCYIPNNLALGYVCKNEFLSFPIDWLPWQQEIGIEIFNNIESRSPRRRPVLQNLVAVSGPNTSP